MAHIWQDLQSSYKILQLFKGERLWGGVREREIRKYIIEEAFGLGLKEGNHDMILQKLREGEGGQSRAKFQEEGQQKKRLKGRKAYGRWQMTNEKLFCWNKENAKGNGHGHRVEVWKSGVVFPKSQDEDIKRREKWVNGAGQMVGSDVYEHIPLNKPFSIDHMPVSRQGTGSSVIKRT